eukprot:146802-Prymnesium_polylepis.1
MCGTPVCPWQALLSRAAAVAVVACVGRMSGSTARLYGITVHHTREAGALTLPWVLGPDA